MNLCKTLVVAQRLVYTL